jgi:hypothetical protein
MTYHPRLLPTTEADIPPNVFASLGSFCATCPEVDRGYVCRVERLAAGVDPLERLAFAIKVVTPVDAPSDGVVESRNVLERFSRENRDLAEEVGLTLLADRAVPVWENQAVRIFVRERE